MPAEKEVLAHFLPPHIPEDVTLLLSHLLPQFCKFCLKFHPPHVNLQYKHRPPTYTRTGWGAESEVSRTLVPLLNRVYNKGINGWKLNNSYQDKTNTKLPELPTSCSIEYLSLNGLFEMNATLTSEGRMLLECAKSRKHPIIELSGCIWPAETLGLAIMLHKNLVVLKINDCWITDKAGADLVKQLRQTSVKVFILTCTSSFLRNRVADETATALGKVLPFTSIEVLDLSGNKITLAGVKSILGGLGNVKVLNLSRNNLAITNEISETKNKTTLKQKFFGNQPPKQTIDLMTMIKLVSESGLISLDISKNRFGNEGVDMIVSAMGRFKWQNLKELNLFCNFDSRDISSLPQVYEHTNTKIAGLCLSVRVNIGKYLDAKSYYEILHLKQ